MKNKNKEPKAVLYELTFTSKSNPSIAPRVEYLKCKSKELLQKGAKQWMASPHSEYYGYDKVEIYKVSGFSEILSIELEIDEKYTLNSDLINDLEGKIIGCKKAITKYKSQINDIRQDKKCTKKVANVSWCSDRGTCDTHYKCDNCGKLHYTDFFLARIKTDDVPESWKSDEFKSKPTTTIPKKTIKTTLHVYNDSLGADLGSIPVKHITYHIEAATMKELSALENEIINYHHDKIVCYEGGEVV